MSHKFPYKWRLSDGYPAAGIEKHGAKVFGTFVCGGGSTMGYKLAGYEHIGGVEIDPKVAAIYKANHNPKHLFVEDIRVFNQRTDLPAELYNLDLLDGSPPCSSFSMAGNREKDWGKKKRFREGQEFQRLDDLVFEYVKTIEKLQPKVALLENVKGLITGSAKAYAKKLKAEFEAAGYRVQVFLLNAASMGVPQKRERVFFIGLRKDFDLPGLVLSFDEKPVLFGEIEGGFGKPNSEHDNMIWSQRAANDMDFGQTLKRIGRKAGHWGSKYIHSDKVCNTIISASGSKLIEFGNPYHLSEIKIRQIGTYPLDYNFKGIEPKYIIGMSVPPVMTAQIAHQIWLQWLSKIR